MNNIKEKKNISPWKYQSDPSGVVIIITMFLMSFCKWIKISVHCGITWPVRSYCKWYNINNSEGKDTHWKHYGQSIIYKNGVDTECKLLISTWRPECSPPPTSPSPPQPPITIKYLKVVTIITMFLMPFCKWIKMSVHCGITWPVRSYCKWYNINNSEGKPLHDEHKIHLSMEVSV